VSSDNDIKLCFFDADFFHATLIFESKAKCLPIGLGGATTLSITTFGIMTLGIRSFHVTLSISDSQHK
jgi:hypothetical protein